MHTLQSNEIIGAVRLNNLWKIFAGTSGEWIMDYKKYDPAYNPNDSDYMLRNNQLQIDETNAQRFCDAMKDYELSINDIISMKQRITDRSIELSILINFDDKLYVNGYYDLTLEDYAPKNWASVFDDPIKFVPDFIKKAFSA